MSLDVEFLDNSCKKKEKYGQKVRKDIRSILDQAAKMWVYLNSIGKLGEFKAYAADIILAEKDAKAAKKAMYAEKKRQAAMERAEDRKERKFEDEEARRRSKKSRLDERYSNRGYYY